MKITYQGENGTSRLILQPETGRDRAYLDLCRGDKYGVRLEASKDPETLVIVFETKREA